MFWVISWLKLAIKSTCWVRMSHTVESFFINHSNLDADAVEAQEAYRKVVTYFGETSKTMPPETFFPMFDRFIKAYGKAETDLEKWNLLQQKNLEKREQVSFLCEFGQRILNFLFSE